MTNHPEEDSGFTPWRLALVIGILILAAYPEIVLGTHAFFYRDYGLFTYPLAWYHRASFWHGEVPLWNPLSNCGLPFLAQWNTAVFYPFSLIYVLLPMPWSLSYFGLAHLFLAGLGMYFLALRWYGNRLAASFAGIVFVWNGLTINCLMWTSTLATLAWMPWAVLFVERAWQEGGRRLVPAVLIVSCQFLAGTAEIIGLTWIILGTLALVQGLKKTVPWPALMCRFAMIFFLMLCLCAVQFLPFLDFLLHSNRDPTYASNQWAMPVWGLGNFLVPLLHSSASKFGVYSQADQQWTSSYYVGIGTVGLALLAMVRKRPPNAGVLAGLIVASIFLAMGEDNPVYVLLKKLVPPLGMMRFPVKMIVVAVFALPLLAAGGLIRYQQPETGNPDRIRRELTISGVALAILVGGILVAAYFWPLPDDSWVATLQNALIRLVFLAVTWVVVFRMNCASSLGVRRILNWSFIVLAGLDGLTHTPRQNPTVTTRAYGPSGVQDDVIARPGQSRVMVSPFRYIFLSQAATPDPLMYFGGFRRSLFLNSNLIEGIPSVRGFFPLYLKEEAKVDARLYNVMYSLTNVFPEPLADFMGVSQTSAPDQMYKWQMRTNYMPLVSIGQRPVFASDDEALRSVGSLKFNPRAEVFLPLEAREKLTATNTSVAQAKLDKFSPQELLIETDASQPAMVVLSQSYYHLWHAYLDDKPVRIWRANYAFQAMEVPAGHHIIRLAYEDRPFRTGAAITLTTLLGCVAVYVRQKKSSAPMSAT